MSDLIHVRRALISVADKSGVVPFARSLADLGVVIVSSGTTAAVLERAGVPVTPVSDVTGFPEMLEGRVKTLHPRVHAGILADRRKQSHREELERNEIEAFDLVVVNLYPFAEAAASGAPIDEVIEQIDVGGPALVRAAAKNFESVGVVVSSSSYRAVIEDLHRLGGLSRKTRLRFAREAFSHTAAYDTAIASWFSRLVGDAASDTRPYAAEEGSEDLLPQRFAPTLIRKAPLRYGENPHQRASLYVSQGSRGPLGGAEVLQGKEMSFNNWLDAEAARSLAASFEAPAAVIVKHHNPCGAAIASSPAEAYEKALACDPVSAFGGIVAFNREVDEAAARALSAVFTEVVLAPAFAEPALAAFAERVNLRVLRAPTPSRSPLDVRHIDGGGLIQEHDLVTEGRQDMEVVTAALPSDDQWDDLLFAWKVAARVKSNAIVLAREGATVGVGAGQMNRLTSVDIAARHAGDRARGSCLASDAFFPFRDGLDRAARAGIAAVIQPGGSVRDEEVISAAEEHGIAMVFSGRRHFRH